MDSITPIKLELAERLKKDKDFRVRFFRRRIQDEIAMALRSLRKKRKMNQIEFARESGMQQSAVSRMEQADYSGWSFNTLFRASIALNARLRIVFEPMEETLEGYRLREHQETIGGVGIASEKFGSTIDERVMEGIEGTNPDVFDLAMPHYFRQLEA